LRYRDVSSLADISRDIAVVVDFVGLEEYRSSLDAIGRSLRAKGFVTPFDDAHFSLELDLFNLEQLRSRCSGLFPSLPMRCHRGLDFLIGLGQTIPALSGGAKARLLGRLRSGLKEGLWPLEHELRVAANLSKRGWNLYFHDLEEGGGYDFLAHRTGAGFEVEAKAVSAFTGWPIKPDNLGKLLLEIKRRFVWKDERTIPVLRVQLSSALLPERTQLQGLVDAFSNAAGANGGVSLSSAQIQFVGTVPDLAPVQLSIASYKHACMVQKIVLVNPTRPKLVLELSSEKPVQLERKIAKTINEAARMQFSRSSPGLIWTHVNFISDEAFRRLGSQHAGTPFLDRVANAALLSEKRTHLAQLIFSGGSFQQRTGSTVCSSYKVVVYDSPACHFGKKVIFQGGRVRPVPKSGKDGAPTLRSAV
jgi:hypothetical protein